MPYESYRPSSGNDLHAGDNWLWCLIRLSPKHTIVNVAFVGMLAHVASTRMLCREFAFTDSELESNVLATCVHRPCALTDLAWKSPVPPLHANRFGCIAAPVWKS